MFYQKRVCFENRDSDNTCQGFTARSISRLGPNLAFNVIRTTLHHEHLLVLLVQVFDLISKHRLLVHGLVVFKWRCCVSGMQNFSTITHNNSLTYSGGFEKPHRIWRRNSKRNREALIKTWPVRRNRKASCPVSRSLVLRFPELLQMFANVLAPRFIEIKLIFCQREPLHCFNHLQRCASKPVLQL